MVIPGMTVQELSGRLQKECSGLGVIYMSGYSEEAAAEAAHAHASTRLLTKPFSRNTILRAVREVLGHARGH